MVLSQVPDAKTWSAGVSGESFGGETRLRGVGGQCSAAVQQCSREISPTPDHPMSRRLGLTYIRDERSPKVTRDSVVARGFDRLENREEARCIGRGA